MKIETGQKISSSTGQVKNIIKKIIKTAGLNQSIYLEDPSGIGKSEMVLQLANELNAELTDIRLGQLDTIDLNGIGIPDIKNKKAIFTRPDFLPDEDSKKNHIVFLDEFNHANEQVFGAAYQFVLEHRIGQHKLPKNVLIIGAGNSIDDRGISFNMPSPLVNRFMKFNVKSETNDWLEYADQINIDWRIKGFIKSYPEYLHKFNPNTKEDNFPTPRNWVKLNQYSEHFSDIDFMSFILNSLFGYTCMVQFRQYINLVSKMPNIIEILEGKSNEILLKDLSSSYAFYMLVRNYLKINMPDMNENKFINLFKYISLQENKEVMEMLIIEIITIINKHCEPELKSILHNKMFKGELGIKSNAAFIDKMNNFVNGLSKK